MILDISDNKFKALLNDRELFLPRSWDGVYFDNTLKELYNYYIEQLRYYATVEKSIGLECHIGMIEEICKLLVATVDEYLKGFPACAFDTFKKVMEVLSRHAFKLTEPIYIREYGSIKKCEDELKTVPNCCYDFVWR